MKKIILIASIAFLFSGTTLADPPPGKTTVTFPTTKSKLGACEDHADQVFEDCNADCRGEKTDQGDGEPKDPQQISGIDGGGPVLQADEDDLKECYEYCDKQYERMRNGCMRAFSM